MAWDFFVQHYDDGRASATAKYRDERGGVLYPRAGTLGGCTAHNAMITVVSARQRLGRHRRAHRRRVVERGQDAAVLRALERCRYRQPPQPGETNPSGHGFDGWLRPARVDPAHRHRRQADHDRSRTGARSPFAGRRWRLLVIAVLHRGASSATSMTARRSERRAQSRRVRGDDHHHPAGHGGGQAQRHARVHPRTSRRRIRDRLTRPDEHPRHARAVSTTTSAPSASSTWRARTSIAPIRTPAASAGVREEGRTAHARGHPRRRRVQHAAAPDALRHRARRSSSSEVGIECLVDLPGVGRTCRTATRSAWSARMDERLRDARGRTFGAPARATQPIRCFEQWLQRQRRLHLQRRDGRGDPEVSKRRRPDPDLFIFGLPGDFQGYFPATRRTSTKRQEPLHLGDPQGAHEQHAPARCSLRSTDPRDTPDDQLPLLRRRQRHERATTSTSVVDGVEARARG